jgi:hypothetical protein
VEEIAGAGGVDHCDAERGDVEERIADTGERAARPQSDRRELRAAGSEAAQRAAQIGDPGMALRKAVGDDHDIAQRQQLVGARAGLVDVEHDQCTGVARPRRGEDCGGDVVGIEQQRSASGEDIAVELISA